MNWRKFAIYIFFIFTLSCIKIKTQEDIHGEWKGLFNGEEVIFKFKNDGKCVLIIKNDSIPNNHIYKGTYELEFLKKPATLSIRNIPKVRHPLHTIIQFTSQDTIRLGKFSPRWRLRPLSIDHQNSILLIRR